MNTTATAIVPCMRAMLGLSEALLRGVSDASCATLARGIDSNHPAWAYGHLSIYPDRILEALGRNDLARPKPDAYTALFRAKTQCLDDPKRTIYPPLEEIASHFRDRYTAIINTAAELKESDFDRPSPIDGLKDRGITTMGGVINFMGVFHPMLHLGQVSAWRRAMGLGSAM